MIIDAKRLIIALDYDDPQSARKVAGSLAPLGVSFKVGFELFMAGGPEFVSDLASRYPLFLDLKFNDIPNTVAAAVRVATKLGVWMLNLHASGGKAMMIAAREAAEESAKPPLLIAVTVLTSLGAEDMTSTGCSGKLSERVTLLAQLAAESGMDGVVCSPWEIRKVKTTVTEPFLTVTPGIRPIDLDRNDQTRIAAPRDVIDAGGDYLVVGRPITRADNPIIAAQNILEEMEG